MGASCHAWFIYWCLPILGLVFISPIRVFLRYWDFPDRRPNITHHWQLRESNPAHKISSSLPLHQLSKNEPVRLSQRMAGVFIPKNGARPSVHWMRGARLSIERGAPVGPIEWGAQNERADTKYFIFLWWFHIKEIYLFLKIINFIRWRGHFEIYRNSF